MSLPAVLYARYSSALQDCATIDVQYAKTEAYCVANSYVVHTRYADQEMSGKRADNRPGLQSAIKAACETRGVLVVYSLSRLARNTRDAIDIVRRLEQCRAQLASITERIDTASPAGRLFFTLMSALAQFEREQTAERTRDALRHHQANGRRMTRPDQCPFGFSVDPADPARLVPNPSESAAIALMLKLRGEGVGFRHICTALGDAGHAARGGLWYPQTVKRILARQNA